jgi:hypothetical protein
MTSIPTAQQWGNGVLYIVVNDPAAATGEVAGKYARFGSDIATFDTTSLKNVDGGWAGMPNVVYGMLISFFLILPHHLLTNDFRLYV